MAWTVLLLGLLTYSSGVDSQTVVTQEPSMSVSPGGTVTLTCGLSSGSVSSSNYATWYQQTPGKAPRTLIYSTNNRPSGVPDRFSGSISGNKAILTITGARPEDEDDYYCLLYPGVDSQTVVTQEPSLSVSPGGTVTLTCGLSSGSVSTSYYPSWYQQTPGKAPHMFIYETKKRPSGVPEHFTGSISGNKAALTITGAQPEDEADYHYALYKGSYTYTVM